METFFQHPWWNKHLNNPAFELISPRGDGNENLVVLLYSIHASEIISPRGDEKALKIERHKNYSDRTLYPKHSKIQKIPVASMVREHQKLHWE